MIEVNIKLSDGVMVTLTIEQAKELHEKLGQVFVRKDSAPALPWTMPFVQPVMPPMLTPSTPTLPYITWGGCEVIEMPCGSGWGSTTNFASSDATARLSREM